MLKAQYASAALRQETSKLEKRGLAKAGLALFCFLLAGPVHADADSEGLLTGLVEADSRIAKALSAGDAAEIWVVRRSLNRDRLVSDMGDKKPDDQAIACLVARESLAEFANTAILALATDTISGAGASDARIAVRQDADEAARQYRADWTVCVDGQKSKGVSAIASPLGLQLAVRPVSPEAMTEDERRRAMIAALSPIFEAEKQLVTAVDEELASQQDRAFTKGTAALFAFGRAQAAIPDGVMRFLPCRRLGGAMFQLYDMAAAAIDLRLAQGKNFDPKRWPDVVATFDSAREDAEIRKRACTDELGLEKAAGLAVPPRLLDRLKTP